MLNSFYWLLEGKIAGMGMPTACNAYVHLGDADEAARNEMAHEIDELKAHGITAVVTLTEGPLPSAQLNEAGLATLHIPVPDMTAPTPTQIEECIAFTNEQIDSGGAVVMHCLGGSGRTGTMLACYLVNHGTDPNSAIRQVRAVRPSAIETRWQEEAIFLYADQNAQADFL